MKSCSLKNELKSTIATGLSKNHLIRILIAIFGGYLWIRIGIEFLFNFAALPGTGLIVISMMLQKT